MIRIKDLHISRLLNVAGANNARAFLFQRQALWAFGVHYKSDFLDVHNHVGHVFTHTSNRRELMQHAINLNGCYSGTLKRRKKNAAQRVAQRGAKSAFQRFGNNSSHTLFIFARLNFNLGGADKFLPIFLINLHVHVPVCLRKIALPKLGYLWAAQTCATVIMLYATLLWWTATIVRNGRDIADRCHLQASGLQRTKR